LAFTL